MATKQLDPAAFKEFTANGIVLVDFGAPWCAPCHAFASTFAKVSEANPDIAFAEVNIEDAPKLVTEFAIQAVPTLLVFREGDLVHHQPGAQPAHSLQRLVDEMRASHGSGQGSIVTQQNANAA
jgi:thioredoxin 1